MAVIEHPKLAMEPVIEWQETQSLLGRPWWSLSPLE